MNKKTLVIICGIITLFFCNIKIFAQKQDSIKHWNIKNSIISNSEQTTLSNWLREVSVLSHFPISTKVFSITKTGKTNGITAWNLPMD